MALKCPSCRRPVDFSRDTCRHCRVVYREVFEARAWTAKGKPFSRTAVKPPRLGGRLAACAGGVVVAAACAWRLLSPPPGLPLPADAKENASLGFAFSAPAGWSVDASERIREGLVSAARLSDATTSVEVLVGPRALAAQARAPVGAARLASDQFNGSAVRLESTEDIEVDRLPAVRLKVSGGRMYLPSPNAGRRVSPLGQPAPRYESLEFAGELVAVSGSGCSYLIKISSGRDELERHRRLVDGFLSSFRVTRRPLF